jgi:hypothetical protein
VNPWCAPAGLARPPRRPRPDRTEDGGEAAGRHVSRAPEISPRPPSSRPEPEEREVGRGEEREGADLALGGASTVAQPPSGRGCATSSAIGIRGPAAARPWVRPRGDTSPPEVLPETSRHGGWMRIRGWRRESCRGTGRWRAAVVGHRSRWRTGRGGGGIREGGGRLGEERERVRVGAARLRCNFQRVEGLFAKLAGGGAGVSAARHVDREMRGAKETAGAFHFSDSTPPRQTWGTWSGPAVG